ncbi:MAG: glycosyltransferase [Gammaproteobacteria bacterium]
MSLQVGSVAGVITSNPPVTLCIINYNGESHLAHAVDAMRAQAWKFAEILFVDDASTDRSVELIKKCCPEAACLQLESNRGPGAARNAGFAAAKHDLILFQDNDIQLSVHTATILVEHLRDKPDTLLVAPRVVYADDPGKVQYDSANCHYLGLMALQNANVPTQQSDNTPTQTTSLVSACFLINRSIWGREPLFDEDMIFNLEDHELGVRATLLGYSLWCQPDAVVKHGSGTPGLSYRPGLVPSRQRLFCLIRNRWVVIAKCFSTKTLLILLPAILLFELMQLCWLISERKPAIWFHAAKSLFSERERLIRERGDLQARRRAPDRSILVDAAIPLTEFVRKGFKEVLISGADWILRGYWRLVRNFV